MGFLIVKYIHILAAIVAVGFNASYAVWIVRAQREPGHVPFALKGIKFLDDRIANPAYGVLLLTGLLMVIFGGFSFTALWIDVALVLYVAAIVLAIRFFTPALRDQIKLAEAGDTTSPAFIALSRRAQLVGQGVGVIVLVILVMMVFKPHL